MIINGQSISFFLLHFSGRAFDNAEKVSPDISVHRPLNWDFQMFPIGLYNIFFLSWVCPGDSVQWDIPDKAFAGSGKGSGWGPC